MDKTSRASVYNPPPRNGQYPFKLTTFQKGASLTHWLTNWAVLDSQKGGIRDPESGIWKIRISPFCPSCKIVCYPDIDLLYFSKETGPEVQCNSSLAENLWNDCFHLFWAEAAFSRLVQEGGDNSRSGSTMPRQRIQSGRTTIRQRETVEKEGEEGKGHNWWLSKVAVCQRFPVILSKSLYHLWMKKINNHTDSPGSFDSTWRDPPPKNSIA